MKAVLSVAQQLQSFVGGVDETDGDANIRIAVLVAGSWTHGFIDYGTSRGLGLLVLTDGEVLGALPPLRLTRFISASRACRASPTVFTLPELPNRTENLPTSPPFWV